MVRLTKTEEELLRLFWAQSRPLTRSEIIELSPDRKWHAGSVHAFLNSMLEKELIRVAGFERTGKRFGRTYCAALTREEFMARQLCASQQGADIPAVLAAMIRAADIDGETIGRLQALLDQKRRELPDK